MCYLCKPSYAYETMEIEDARADDIFLENQKEFRKEREKYLDGLELKVRELWTTN